VVYLQLHVFQYFLYLCIAWYIDAQMMYDASEQTIIGAILKIKLYIPVSSNNGNVIL